MSDQIDATKSAFAFLLNGKSEPSPIKEPPWARIPRPMPIDFHIENPLDKARKMAETELRRAQDTRALSMAVVDLVRKYQRAAERVEVLEAERAGAQGDDMGGQLRAAALRQVAEIAIQLRNIQLPAEAAPAAPQPAPCEEKPKRLRDLILRQAARLALRLVFGKTGDDLKRVRRG